MKKLLILTFASSVLFCDISLAAQSRQTQTSTQSSNSLIAKQADSVDKEKNTTIKSSSAGKYNTFMKAGYKAFDKKDYKTALTNFKSALAVRPNNIYAKRAIQNTEKKLAGK